MIYIRRSSNAIHLPYQFSSIGCQAPPATDCPQSSLRASAEPEFGLRSKEWAAFYSNGMLENETDREVNTCARICNRTVAVIRGASMNGVNDWADKGLST